MALQQIAQRPEAKYNCPVVELYAGLRIVWNNQSGYETEFADENTQYTAGLSVTRKGLSMMPRHCPTGRLRERWPKF
jgi:hypothetical protein